VNPWARRGLGALALLALAALPAAASGRTAGAGPVREYWIAAVPVTWNAVPNGHDGIGHEHVDVSKATATTVVYRRFTRNWERMLPGPGMPGPLIRARVGDRILVHFKNLDNEFERPHSMHFHGVEYPFGADGSYIPGFSGRGANVKPGESFTYRLKAGPRSAGVWPYHDHSPSMMESLEGGLYGALSILGPDERRPDREFVVVLGAQFGQMTINGRAFVGNTPVLHARVGDLVQWDVITLGDEFHTFHVHGHRWGRGGVPEDTRTIGPAESFRVRWREDAPGAWLYHCHVESHMMNGMIGLYRVAR
jgi:FtsP/CotA-like multicopper oxidase with cupredoxin domain